MSPNTIYIITDIFIRHLVVRLTDVCRYCLVAIVEQHDLKLNRSTYDVLRILSMSLFDKTPIKELIERPEPMDDT